MFSSGTKTLLRNVIHHADTHNRIREEAVMWRIRRDTRYRHSDRHHGYRGYDSEDERVRNRRRRPRAPPPKSLCRKVQEVSRAHMDRADSETRKPDGRSTDNYWARKLQKAEMKDPDRWGHSGFKELYPEAVALLHSPSDSPSPSETRKKKKKKKKKHKKSSRRHDNSDSDEIGGEVGPSIDLMVQQKVVHQLPELEDWPISGGIAMAGVRPKKTKKNRRYTNSQNTRNSNAASRDSSAPSARNYRVRIKQEPKSPPPRPPDSESEMYIKPHWVASVDARPPEPPEPHPSDLQDDHPGYMHVYQRRDIWRCEPLPKKSRKRSGIGGTPRRRGIPVGQRNEPNKASGHAPSTNNRLSNKARKSTIQQNGPPNATVPKAHSTRSRPGHMGHKQLATGYLKKSSLVKTRDSSRESDTRVPLLHGKDKRATEMSSDSSDSDSESSAPRQPWIPGPFGSSSDSDSTGHSRRRDSSDSSLSSLSSSDSSVEGGVRTQSSSSVSTDSDYQGSRGYQREYNRSPTSSVSDYQHHSWRSRRERSRSLSSVRDRSFSPQYRRRGRSLSYSSQESRYSSRRWERHRQSRESSDSRGYSAAYDHHKSSRYKDRSHSRDSSYSSQEYHRSRRRSRHSSADSRTRTRRSFSLSSDSSYYHRSSRYDERQRRRTRSSPYRDSSSSRERYVPPSKRRRQRTSVSSESSLSSSGS